MKTDELSAWLLHQKPAKNSTTEVFFLTRERGMLRVFCAGGQGAKKRAILQPFTPLWLTLNARHYGLYVKQVEIASSPHLLPGDSLLAGLYLNELLYRALKPELSDTRLFFAYETALEALKRATNQSDIERALRTFEQILIDVSGYQVSYEYEALSHESILPDVYYLFLPGEGFVQDNNGFLGAHILAIGENIWDDAAVLKNSKINHAPRNRLFTGWGGDSNPCVVSSIRIKNASRSFTRR